ncbi:Protein of unknown function [Ruminococcaceae bacterium YRB3002]|nr:Protein of unknown function [Ruminococcaceae bacterium YRB3002]
MRLTRDRGRIIGFTAATTVLVVAVVLFVILRGRADSLSFQEGSCMFSRVLHLYCPGCGGTRAVKALLQFDIIGSLLANPVPVYGSVLFVRVWVALAHNVWVSRRGRGSVDGSGSGLSGSGLSGSGARLWRIIYDWEAYGILVVVIGNFVIRNLLLVVFKIDPLGDLVGYW